jgi:phosphoglycerol transferase MdoB-like AlkP superfamily enzyme
MNTARSLIGAALSSAVAIFACGFVLGIARIFLLIPKMGPLYAVALELPVMLVLSWLVWRWSLARFRIAPDVPSRLITGLLAFILLMGFELLLAIMIFEMDAGDFLASLANPAGLLGFAGQCAFGLMPVLMPESKARP